MYVHYNDALTEINGSRQHVAMEFAPSTPSISVAAPPSTLSAHDLNGVIINILPEKAAAAPDCEITIEGTEFDGI